MSIEQALQSGRTITDWGRMRRADIRNLAEPDDEHQLQQLVQFAKNAGMKISLRGIGHSAGGQSFADDVLMIDLRRLNAVLSFQPQKQLVRVQTGAVWRDLTQLLEPAGLSVTTKQEFDTFTIGGSLAANVHGKSVDYGPLIENVESFRLLCASGEIIQVSRDENSELFPLAIGGYGLFGGVVDVTLQLVRDRVVRKTEIVRMELASLIQSYLDRVAHQPRPPLCYGFLDATCTEGFYVTYEYDGEENGEDGLRDLKRDEPNPHLFNVFVKLQRWSRHVRRRAFHLLWVSGAKAERTLRSRRLLLWDNAPAAFDGMLLQKYFVPAAHFVEFARRAGRVFSGSERELPLMTNHFRFVPGNREAVLSCAPEDAICMIPCYLARKSSPAWVRKLESATEQLVAAALDLSGSYYLTFDSIPSPKQLRDAYPRWDEFCALKRKHDPDELFTSMFYQRNSRADSCCQAQ